MRQGNENASAYTEPSTTGGTTYIPYQGCSVCGGRGIVYGLDGKPYLCPKCGGGSPYPYPYWQTTWCSTSGAMPDLYGNGATIGSMVVWQ